MCENVTQISMLASETIDTGSGSWGPGGFEGINDSRGRRTELACRHPGLVVIDAQRVFLDPLSPARLPGSDTVVANILLLAATFRAMKLPVVFTRHVESGLRPRGTVPAFFPRPLDPDDPLSDILPGLAGHITLGGLVNKDRHDAFSHELPARLRGTDVLFVAGVQTPLCVLSTALGLARYGIVPAVVGDACAARERADHIAALRCLAGGHAWVRTTDEALRFLIGMFEDCDDR